MPRRPRGPNADSEQWIRRGLRARASSAPAPRRSATPGEAVHQDVGAVDERAERLAALRGAQVEDDPPLVAVGRGTGGSRRRRRRPGATPPDGSTFTTSAPSCPSVMVASGPPRWWVRSTTRIPASGPGAGMGSDTADLRGDGAVTLSSSPPPANPSSRGASRPRQGPARPSAILPGCARCAARNASTARLTATGASCPSAWAAAGTTATHAGPPRCGAGPRPSGWSSACRGCRARSGWGADAADEAVERDVCRLAQGLDDAPRTGAEVVADATPHQRRALHRRVDRQAQQHLGEGRAEAAVEGGAEEDDRGDLLGPGRGDERGDVAATSGPAARPAPARGRPAAPAPRCRSRRSSRSAPTRCGRSPAGRSSRSAGARPAARPAAGGSPRRPRAVQHDDRLNSARPVPRI